MEAVAIREFMKYQPKELLLGYKTTNNVLFEDGVVVENMNYKEVVYTRYMLEVLVAFPNIPIESKYRISNYYTNGIATSKTINKCFEVMLEDIIKKVMDISGDYSMLSVVHKRMYEITNDVYNDFGYDNIEYITSSNILDFLEIQMNPDLLDSIRKVDKNKDVESINEAYVILDNLLTNEPMYVNNPISKSYVSGMVNPNQIKQILGPRGYVTEIDGSIFKYPIASSFTLGLNSIYDMALESRSAAKALFLSNIAVQDSEYLARELQLVSMAVERLVKTDCGNNEYINWYVRPAIDGGKSDLHNLVGKRYWDDINNVEAVIGNQHKHLEGKTIKLRSVLKCKLKDPSEICLACMGELGYSIHDHSTPYS